ncbi:MAG: beta strand repeat-containing protein, partial [Acidithiobacillus sp.]
TVNGAASVGGISVPDARDITFENSGALTIVGSTAAGSAGSIPSTIPVSGSDIGAISVPITLASGAIVNSTYSPGANSSGTGSAYPVVNFNYTGSDPYPVEVSGNGTLNLIDGGVPSANGITTIENFNIPGVTLEYTPNSRDSSANTISNISGGNFVMNGNNGYSEPVNVSNVTTSGNVALNDPSADITLSGPDMTAGSMNVSGNNVTVNSGITTRGNLSIVGSGAVDLAIPSGGTTSEVIQSSNGDVSINDYSGLNVGSGVTVAGAQGIGINDASNTSLGATGVNIDGELNSESGVTINSSGPIIVGSGGLVEASGQAVVASASGVTIGSGSSVTGNTGVSVASGNGTVSLAAQSTAGGITTPGGSLSANNGAVDITDGTGFSQGAGAAVTGAKGITISDNSPAPTAGSTNTGGVTLDGSLASTGGTITVSSPNNDVTQGTGGTMNATDIQVSAPTGTIMADGSMTTGNGGVWIDPATITYDTGAKASAYDNVVEDSTTTITGAGNLTASPKAITASSEPTDTTISLDGNAVTVAGTLNALAASSTAGGGLVSTTTTTTSSTSTSSGGGSTSFVDYTPAPVVTTTTTTTPPPVATTATTTTPPPVATTATTTTPAPVATTATTTNSDGSNDNLNSLADITAAQDVINSGNGGGVITISPDANTTAYSGSNLVIPAGSGSGMNDSGSGTNSASMVEPTPTPRGGSGSGVSHDSASGYTSGTSMQRQRQERD